MVPLLPSPPRCLDRNGTLGVVSRCKDPAGTPLFYPEQQFIKCVNEIILN